MPIFVHLAPESKVDLIRRNGIALSRGTRRGVFAMPVTRNYYVSHQWLRELRRWKHNSIAGIYFRIPDDEPVRIGHYGAHHHEMTAAEAVKEFMAGENREGWEVIISRRIQSTEIHRTRSLRQVTGWRFYPAAKGKKPFCTCKFCTRGEYGARKLRKKFPADD